MVKRIGQNSARPGRTFFREWREHRGLSQEKLADKLGTNKSGVSKIERGDNRYNQSSLEAWAKALDCEPSDLISRPPGETDIVRMFEAAHPEVQRAIERILRTDP